MRTYKIDTKELITKALRIIGVFISYRVQETEKGAKMQLIILGYYKNRKYKES